MQIFSKSAVRRSKQPQSPGGKLLLRESRVVVDIAKLPIALGKSYRNRKRNTASNKPLVILFPGYATDTRYLAPLRWHIEHLGYETTDWGLGKNMAGVNYQFKVSELNNHWSFELPQGVEEQDYFKETSVAYLIDRACEKVMQQNIQDERQLIFIGWSLGGYIAREVARLLKGKKKNQIAHVITLGSPVIGGPKYTRAAKIYQASGYDLDWIEREINRNNQPSLSVPVTAIISETDAIVDWRATLDKHSNSVVHWRVNSSHLGLGFHRDVWRIIDQTLEKLAPTQKIKTIE